MFRRRPDSAEPGTTTSTAWTPISAAEFFLQVKSLAAGFLAAGFAPGQRVGLLSRTRYEWTLTDYALWHAGLVTVPIYETSAPDQICWILGDSQAVGVVVETDKHASAVADIRDQIPDLRKIWVIEKQRPRRAGARGRRSRLDGTRGGAGVGQRRLTRVDHLHVRHHRPAEGLRPHPSQPLVRRDQRGRQPARAVHRRHQRAALPAPGACLRARHPGRPGASGGPCRPLPDHPFVAGRPRRVQADAAARRPLCVRKALCRRATEGRRREQGQDLRACVRHRDQRQRGDGARQGAADSAAEACGARHPRVSQAPRRTRRRRPVGNFRRRAARRPARPFLSGCRHPGARRVGPHRDDGGRSRQPP